MATLFMESFGWPQTAQELISSGKWSLYDTNAGEFTPYSGTWGFDLLTASPAYVGGRYVRLWEDKGANTGSTFHVLDLTLPTGVSELFLSSRVRAVGPVFSASQGFAIEFFSGFDFIQSVGFLQSGAVQIRRGSPAGTVQSSVASGGATPDAWQSFQIRFLKSPTSGVVDVRKNGASSSLVSFSGDTQNGVAGLCDRIRFWVGIGLVNALSNPPLLGLDISDVFVNSTSGAAPTGWPGDVAVRALGPTGAGASTQWTPVGAAANWQADALPSNGDTSYVESSTVGAKDLYALGPALPLDGGTVHAVQPFVLTRKVDPGARTVGARLLSGTTEVDGATSNAIGTGYTFVGAPLALDPDTGAVWGKAAVNAVQVGPRVVA